MFTIIIIVNAAQNLAKLLVTIDILIGQFNPHDDIFAELHYAGLGKKTFRRSFFEFSNGTMGFRRDARVSMNNIIRDMNPM